MNNQLFIIIGDTVNSRFYVYELCNPITKLPFYVGKGTRHRCKTHFTKKYLYEGYNFGKQNEIKEILTNNNQVLVKIVHNTDDENDALSIEIQLIALYGRRDIKTGILTNLTNGGERSTGYHHTVSSKQKISNTRNQRIKSGKILPVKHTEEWKQHLRENNAGGKATSKQIYQINTDGSIIKLWNSTKHAGESLNIKTWRNISDCANKYPSRTVGGFYWRWEDDSSVVNNKLTGIEELNLCRLDRSLKSGKSLRQVNANTNEIKIWKNQSECARQLKLKNTSSISQAIKSGKLYLNCLWYNN